MPRLRSPGVQAFKELLHASDRGPTSPQSARSLFPPTLQFMSTAWDFTSEEAAADACEILTRQGFHSEHRITVTIMSRSLLLPCLQILTGARMF